MEAPSLVRLAVAAMAVAAFSPTGANAAEVVASAPDEVEVRQGALTTFEVEVSAEGFIDCRVSRSSPSTARFETVYSLVDDQPQAAADPGGTLPFYASDQLVLLPPLGCGVTWDTAPEPYRFEVTVAAASTTPEGAYTIDLSAAVGNPSDGLFSPLEDEQPEQIRIVVTAPPTPPAPPEDLPPPLENRSVNLLPVRGDVQIRYPNSSVSVPLTDPVQVPPATSVNAEEGYVTLLTDRVGTGVAQSATLWDDRFKVYYTRVANPESPGKERRAKLPITELTLSGGPGKCGARTAHTAARAAGRGKGLWAKGKGRFRTRGRFGAGTVRGTEWFTSETCEGTLFRVRHGVVVISDLTVRRNFAVGAGGSYLVQPPDPRRGTSRG